MNEIFFISHIILVVLFSLGALRLGKEALSVWAVLQMILGNLFVLKQINLFGLQVTCSDVYIIGSIVCLNLLQEFFSKKDARRVLMISFYAMVFFTVMAQLHLRYVPSKMDVTDSAYRMILNPSPRILLASIAAFFISQRLELFLFGTLKERFPKWNLSTRNALSSSCSQMIDTTLFTFIGLYGIIHSPFNIIVLSSAIKLITIASSSPFLLLCRKVRPREV